MAATECHVADRCRRLAACRATFTTAAAGGAVAAAEPPKRTDNFYLDAEPWRCSPNSGRKGSVLAQEMDPEVREVIDRVINYARDLNFSFPCHLLPPPLPFLHPSPLPLFLLLPTLLLFLLYFLLLLRCLVAKQSSSLSCCPLHLSFSPPLLHPMTPTSPPWRRELRC